MRQDRQFSWWCPEPRAILQIENLHVSRSLRRTLKSNKFLLRSDTNFASVIDGCAERAKGTWITSEMRAAYLNLHQLGRAHSFEVWTDNELVGGLYGVQAGALFAAESMFHRVTDASKIALVAAVTAHSRRAFRSLTCNSNASFGESRRNSDSRVEYSGGS